jgi:ubiquinone/menaquinone biosynthesis C-methylase UbiE
MPDEPVPPSDTYVHGHHASVLAQHRRRTAEGSAGFLLPRLEPGMRLLDVGCGPGTITTGLAEAVAPGRVTAIDVADDVLEVARSVAAERGVANVTFEQASVYDLPYEAGSFDVAYAHQVLQHLAKPVNALREIRRVLQPGGLVAVRDGDYQTMVSWPHSEQIDRFLALYREVASRNGADADAGRRIPSWLAAAGFEEIEVTATTWMFRERDEVLNWGDSWAERVTHSSLAEQAVNYGLATSEELEWIADGWRAWARDPEALFMFIHVEGLGVAPGG